MVLLPSVQCIVDLHCLTFCCIAYNYVDRCCYFVDVRAQEGGKWLESGCASYASHCAFVDGMFRNAVLCTRGTERFMVCCALEHNHVPLN